jgi:cytochrome c oxidase subunit 1
MSSTIDHAHAHDHAHTHHDHAHDHPHGLRRWLFATNHKDIGTLYLWFSFTMLLSGGVLALMIRTELFQPGLQFFRPEFFNQLTTMHGLVMVFGAIMPAFVGFANWMIPLQVGASDMAFARMNNFSFWLLPPAAILLATSFFVPGGATAAGWTLYAPLSTQMGPGMDMAIFAMHIMGASSIMGSINIIVTILNMRAPGMTLMKMPMFCWTWLITAYLLIAVMPVLAGAITMTLTDRHFGTSFFNAAGGGDPVMYQHIFWFFGHPEVYIMILPAFGIVSQIIPAFARKPLFGYASMVYATASIAILSFIVWAHHMFTTGMPVTSQLFFMYATMLIAVPTGVKVFNWVATMWKGSMTFETPMLFAVGFIFVFTMGGFTGLILAVTPIDIQCRTPITWWRTSTTCWWPARCSRCSPASTTGRRNGPATCTEVPRQDPLLELADLVQRHLLPDALPGPGRHAAPLCRLRGAVHRLQHDRVDRRLRFRPVAGVLPVLRGDADHPRRQEGGSQAMGRRGRPGVDRAEPGAVPHLRNPAAGEVR